MNCLILVGNNYLYLEERRLCMCHRRHMSTIDCIRLVIFILFSYQINMIRSSNNEDNQQIDVISRFEHDDVSFVCDLTDVAWWKRPNLLATRYGMILPKFRSRLSLEKKDENTPPSQILYIRQLQSNDAGIYECETLGAIRQFNLTVRVRLTTVELGTQFVSSYDVNNDYLSNKTDENSFHQSLTSNNEYIHLRENQLIRLTCVVSRAFPAATLHFPFEIDYRTLRNSTVENADQTYRTILVLILRINRYYHQRKFHCQATQFQGINDENQYQQISVLSNTLQMDVAYSPICSEKNSQVYSGVRRPINLTCHMNNGNPTKNNFTWHLPNGKTRLGSYLNTTTNSITLIPEHQTDFGQITCRAQNQLGLFGECQFNMSLGGVPDPIESCRYTYLNATLTVNCLAGYHQGDEDFFCYMYKRLQNGTYSEHARLKGNCAFILPDLKPEYHHDFRVFTKNKFGDNFERGYSIKVGKPKAESFAEKSRIYWPYMALFILGACLLSCILICWSWQKIRKGLNGKRRTKGNFENLTYLNHGSNGKTALVHSAQNGNGFGHPVRPYRSRDHLISSEPSTLHRSNGAFKSIYSADDELLFNRRTTMKETDLDHILPSPHHRSNDTTNTTMKTLPNNRTRPYFSPFPSEHEHYHQSTPLPATVQRRSSFQAATKLNSFDTSPMPDSLYFLNQHFIKPIQRNHYSPEHDYYHRDKQPSLTLDNQMSTTQNAETNSTNEFNRENYQDQYRDDGIFV